MREIKLSQGKVALVDDDDFEYLNQWKWHAYKCRNVFYASRNIVKDDGKKTTSHMHREILGISDPKVLGDHKDHNGLNNQRSNLRLCSVAENCMNKSSKKNSTSKYLGVSWRGQRKIWRADIWHGGKVIYLGSSKNESKAAEVYNNAAKKYHGEFAHLNIF